MKSGKCLLAVLPGTIAVFVWVNVSWMVLEWHGIKSVGEEATSSAALKTADALICWTCDGESVDGEARLDRIGLTTTPQCSPVL
jgi:hypothetical protein